MLQKMKDYYHILGVPDDATPEEIKAGYRIKFSRLARRRKNPDPLYLEDFISTREAYLVLSDPEKRQKYNKSRGIKDWRSPTLEKEKAISQPEYSVVEVKKEDTFNKNPTPNPKTTKVWDISGFTITICAWLLIIFLLFPYKRGKKPFYYSNSKYRGDFVDQGGESRETKSAYQQKDRLESKPKENKFERVDDITYVVIAVTVQDLQEGGLEKLLVSDVLICQNCVNFAIDNMIGETKVKMIKPSHVDIGTDVFTFNTKKKAVLKQQMLLKNSKK